MRKGPEQVITEALKWGAYTYTGVKAIQVAARALDRNQQENTDAAITSVLDSIIDTEKAVSKIMALTNSPGASLNPSRQSARNASRAQTGGPVRTGMTTLLGGAGTDCMRIGSWQLAVNDDGDLVGRHDDGRFTNLTANAAVPEPKTNTDDDPSRSE